MDKKSIIFGVIGFVLGGFLMVIIVNNVVNNQDQEVVGRKSQTASGTMIGNIDQHFIEQMIPHHEDAISMAKIALERGQHQEIKTLAQNIISSQTAENEQMRGWYKEWFGRELPTGDQVMNVHGMMAKKGGMHMGMMGDETDMEKLEQATDFDKAFIEEMIPHHQMAVMMASMLKNGTTRPEMKKLAEDIITAQTNEIELMRNWYKDWGYE